MTGNEEIQIPGVEVTEHDMLSFDPEGRARWHGSIAVDGARGFRSNKEMDDFRKMGGRVALPVDIRFNRPEGDDSLFIAGVSTPDPNETPSDQFLRELGF